MHIAANLKVRLIMIQGKVKWFNNSKGFGFISPEDSELDIFVHFSSIKSEGYKTLKEGQTVQYEAEEGPKGWHAIQVEIGQ